ncbi:MAG: four-carbon acid sugar kinase family protein, partial [Bryobacteraceae bacterium]
MQPLAPAELLIIADDLTGALEAGALLAGEGISTLITLGDELAANAANVCDLETRHLSNAGAARITGDLAHRFTGRYLFKKTDSTLRGPIGAELNAIMRARPHSSLIYAPAYPMLGRTVRNGRLYVDGSPVEQTPFARDPANPVSSGCIADHLACSATLIHDAGELTRHLADAPMPTLFVCDSETESDIGGIVEVALRQAIPPLLAGPASVARYLARLLPVARTAAPFTASANRALVVNGSLHPASRAQTVRAFPLLDSHGWCLLETPAGAQPADFAAEAKRIVAESRPDALILFGGHTAHAVLQALGIRTLTPLGEL